MPADVYLNVAVGGVLTGLVYGLMALGLSVIFGVVRVVNFAHGEMMTIAMYIAVTLFTAFHLDPLVMLVPIAAVMFAFGYVLQVRLINPFITRPEYSQFLLLVALAIIIVNGLLIAFGPDAQNVQTSYAYDSFQIGPLIVDATKAYAGFAAIVVAAALFGFFQYTRLGTAIRACADNLTGAEVRYLVENEWAQCAEDLLWRRSKLGLKATAEELAAIEQFIASMSTPMQPKAP